LKRKIKCEMVDDVPQEGTAKKVRSKLRGSGGRVKK